VPIEPLVLRANAGDCITVNLNNHLPATQSDLPGFNTMPMIRERLQRQRRGAFLAVGLHPQLLTYDVRKSDG